jgi:hypothetical protein
MLSLGVLSPNDAPLNAWEGALFYISWLWRTILEKKRRTSTLGGSSGLGLQLPYTPEIKTHADTRERESKKQC